MATRGLFIPAGLRPMSDAKTMPETPPASAASPEAIRRRAEEALSDWERERLGLDTAKFPAEMWQRCFVPCAHVNATVLEREAVLLNLANGTYYTLNPMGTVIWELFTGDCPLEEIPAVLCMRFAVDEARIRADLASLVTHLCQEQLIEEKELIPMDKKTMIEKPEVAVKETYSEPLLVKHETLSELTGKVGSD